MQSNWFKYLNILFLLNCFHNYQWLQELPSHLFLYFIQLFSLLFVKLHSKNYSTVTKYTNTFIKWLQDNGFSEHGMECKCGAIMRPGRFKWVSEGKGWICPGKTCKNFSSLRIGSFFEGSNLPLTELVEFLYFWSENLQTTSFLSKNLGWSEHTTTDWKNFLRDICVELYLVNPQTISGHGHVVEIDESKFGHRKYSRGCCEDNGFSEAS